MILYEKIILGLIFGIIGIHIIALVIVPTIHSQIVEMEPVLVATVVRENVTARTATEGPAPPASVVERSMVIPERLSVMAMLNYSLHNLSFALLVAFSGIGVFLPWGGVIAQQFPKDLNVLVPVLFFWLSSMASVPILFFGVSKKIPWWRLGPYLYLLPVLIGGVGITYFTNFGA